MSSDETPRIEPKIEPVIDGKIEPTIDNTLDAKIEPTLTVTDAPPLAALDQPEVADAEIATPKAEPALEKIEPKLEPAKADRVETLPPAPQIKTPVAEVIPYRRPDPKPEQAAPAQAAAASRSGRRFAMLAACLAFAASAGALGGSLGVAKLGPMFAEAKPPVLPVVKEKDHVADEVKALKDTVAQLRTTTKALSDNLAALKTSVNSSNTVQNTQIGKIAETLDRVEKTQAEQRKLAEAKPQPKTEAPAEPRKIVEARPQPKAEQQQQPQAQAPAQAQAQQVVAHAAPETTGSIAPQKQAAAVPMVLGDPPTTLKPPSVPGYVLRRVYDGAALIEGRQGMIEVEPGIVVPGLGRIEDIKRQNGQWVVITSRGIIAMAR